MNTVSPKTFKLLTYSMLKGIGPAALRTISTIRDFELKKPDEIAVNIPRLMKVLHEPDAWNLAIKLADFQVSEAHRYSARILSPLDFEYPTLLSATKDDPFIIYVMGSFSSTPEKSVAIIGTRQPTIHGAQITERITQFFAVHQWSIVSGLALGCDSIAHESALQARGHTVAVLAHGLHTVSPSTNKLLAERILQSGGALISEYPFGQNALPQQFVKRDRTQAGMAQGVVMIQSDLKGGSLHASRAILDYDRWLAVPYPTDKDITNNEDKIRANLLITSDNTSETMSLLRCDQSKLKNLITLKSKQDYTFLIEKQTTNKPAQLLQSLPLPKEQITENLLLAEQPSMAIINEQLSTWETLCFYCGKVDSSSDQIRTIDIKERSYFSLLALTGAVYSTTQSVQIKLELEGAQQISFELDLKSKPPSGSKQFVNDFVFELPTGHATTLIKVEIKSLSPDPHSFFITLNGNFSY